MMIYKLTSPNSENSSNRKKEIKSNWVNNLSIRYWKNYKILVFRFDSHFNIILNTSSLESIYSKLLNRITISSMSCVANIKD